MAEKHEVIEAIEALATHCRPPLMGVEERVRWVMDWCADLKEFPIENVRIACQRWRQGDDRKFPMPGQLIPMIRATLRVADDGGKPQPWRPLSDDEYRNLTVREKIRHHQILAHEAMGKGGPMYRQAATVNQRGTHLTPDDMPAEWHEGRREAAFHHAEIKRLREIIANGPMHLARRSA